MVCDLCHDGEVCCQVHALQARVKELEGHNAELRRQLQAEEVVREDRTRLAVKLRKVVDAEREAAKDASASRGHNPDEECCSLCGLAKALRELDGDYKNLHKSVETGKED